MMETKTSTIQFEDLNFIKISDQTDLEPSELDSFDAVIIEQSNRQATKKAVKQIRTDNDKEVYLKPVFILKTYRLSDEFSQANPLVDGILYSDQELGRAAFRVRELKERIF